MRLVLRFPAGWQVGPKPDDPAVVAASLPGAVGLIHGPIVVRPDDVRAWIDDLLEGAAAQVRLAVRTPGRGILPPQ